MVVILGVCLVLIIVIILAVKFLMGVYVPFVEERDFIRMEIMRNYGKEQAHWKHELHRLYLAQIPFIGVYLAERNRKRGEQQRLGK